MKITTNYEKELKSLVDTFVVSNIGETADVVRAIESVALKDNMTKWTLGRLAIRVIDSFGKAKEGRKYILDNTSLNKVQLSKIESAVRFCLERHISYDNNMGDFQFSKVYVISSNPTNFVAMLDKGRFADIMTLNKEDLESVAKGDKKLSIYKGEVSAKDVKAVTKTDSDSDDTTKDTTSETLIRVTDEKGVVYAIPKSVLDKYVVAE